MNNWLHMEARHAGNTFDQLYAWHLAGVWIARAMEESRHG